MKRVSNFSAARQQEAARRYYAKDNGEIEKSIFVDDASTSAESANKERVAETAQNAAEKVAEKVMAEK
jgi:hypothetical protein